MSELVEQLPEWSSWLRVDELALELGHELYTALYMSEIADDSILSRAIPEIRRQIAQEIGLLTPDVRVLKGEGEPSSYRILFRGEQIAAADLWVDKKMAIHSQGGVALDGFKTVDPSFALEAYWIDPAHALKAQSLGYTVIDPGAVLSTHLKTTMLQFAGEIFDYSNLEVYLATSTRLAPRLVEMLFPDENNTHLLFQILRNLLHEQLSIRDHQTILTALADYLPQWTDAHTLTELIRRHLRRQISRKFTTDDGVLHCISFAPDVEDILVQGLKTVEVGGYALQLSPEVQLRIVRGITSAAEQCRHQDIVILCPNFVRGALHRVLQLSMERPPACISSNELMNNVVISRIATVSLKGVKIKNRS